MNIAFYDPFQLDYVVSTPYRQPLGGAESSLCHLAAELARLGHAVTVLNSTSTPGVHLGVTCLNRDHETSLADLRRFDRIIVLNVPVASHLRPKLGPEARLILWSGDAHDMPRPQLLGDPAEQRSWDAIVFKSEWQRRKFIERFGLRSERTKVLHNAVGPPFQDLFAERGDVLAAKYDPPILAYTSTPFRGLEVLLKIFPAVRRRMLGVRLRVYSSMQVYQYANDRAAFGGLYQRCSEMEGVEYIGSLPQPELARALRCVSVLAYPCTYAEMYCTSVMEAMAAGCRIVTSDLGAMPETTGGYATLVPHIKPGENPERFARDFSAALTGVLEETVRDAPIAEKRLGEAIARVNQFATWPVRAREWSQWLEAMG